MNQLVIASEKSSISYGVDPKQTEKSTKDLLVGPYPLSFKCGHLLNINDILFIHLLSIITSTNT